MEDDKLAAKLPDISSDKIAHDAWLIYEMIRNTGEYKRGRVRQHDGKPGREWIGSMNKIVDALWPALSDRYLVTKEQADELKLTLNRYLRNSRNLVCMRNGGVTAPSTWWLNDNWAPVTLTHSKRVDVINDPAIEDVADTPEEPYQDVSDVFNVQVPEPTQSEPKAVSQPVSDPSEEEEMSEPTVTENISKPHKCRFDGCKESFPGANHRAAHERSHGIRVNKDGSVTTFEVSAHKVAHTVGEVNRLLVDVATEAGEGKTMYDLLELAQTRRPMIPKSELRLGIDRLLTKPWNGHTLVKVVTPSSETGRTRTVRYHLETVKPTPAVIPPKTVVSQVYDAVTKARTNLHSQPEGSKDVEEHAANLRALLTDLGRLAKFEEGLAASKAKNDELVERLRTMSAEDDEKRELRERLAAVTAERDALQAKLDALRSVFGSAFGN